MNERTNHLHNMCGSSRSSVAVQPRHVEPPPTTARGARVRGTTAVLVSLTESCRRHGIAFPRDDAQLTANLRQWFALPGTSSRDDVEDLRNVADEAIRAVGLVGCVIFQERRQVDRQGNRPSNDVVLTDIRLVFAILTKTSDRLFIATKTPNLSINLLTRELVAFDPRLIAIAGGQR